MNEYLNKFNTLKLFNFDDWAQRKCSDDDYFESVIKAHRCREWMVKRYAWAIPNDVAIETIKEYGSIIEIGAGTGYWASLIKNVVTFDINTNRLGIDYWHDVKEGSFEKIIDYPNHTLMLCWPPYESSLVDDCLGLYEGKVLIYIGEYNGCTAWSRQLNRQWKIDQIVDIPTWPNINDKLMIFKR